MGHLNLDSPHCGSPYFWWILFRITKYFASGAQLSPSPKWELGAMRNYRPKRARQKAADRYEAPTYAYPARAAAALWRNRAEFSNIPGVRISFPDDQMGKGKCKTTNEAESPHRNNAGRYGSWRGA